MVLMDNDSEFVRHTPCPHCGSSDANSLFSDGHYYCFSCETYTPSDEEKAVVAMETDDTMFLDLDFKELKKRGLTQQTCQMWGYGVSTYKGQKVQVANYRDAHGKLHAQKIRFANKDFSVLGNIKQVGLFGEHLWRDGGRFVTICEGELDAMSVSQANGNKWASVSVPSGCNSAKKAVGKSIEWLSKFDHVVLCFDMDEQGQRAAIECASVLPPNKAKIVRLPEPYKDANEMLVDGKVKELINALYEAKVFRPDGIIAGTDVWDLVISTDDKLSVPYPYLGIQEKTGGCRRGEIVTLTAGSGIGKSQLAREFAHGFIKHGQTIGYIALEENVKRTSLGLMSIELNKPLHLQNNDVPEEEMRQAFDSTVGSGRVYLYDHWGSTDSDNLLSKIRYLVRGCGCEYIILDHISIVVSGMEGGDERRIIDNTMTALRSLVEELNCGMILVSHLKRPSGDRGHEDGAQTSMSQLRGSAAIGQLSDIVIGLERNQQDTDSPNVSQVRVLKNRWSGDTGLCCALEYMKDTGRMVETYFNNEDVEDIPF
jgi:twinkle protein